jgi:DNA repair exonuclease SbcCD ATPase subunit
MAHFLSQHLTGVHYFADQGFDFDQEGISLILGENRNSGKDKQNTNAVGKSLFFSQLPEMITEEPRVGTRADRLRKGTRSLKFRVGKNVYEFQQSFGPSKNRVLKNGVDLGIHGVAPAHEYFRNKIGMSDAEIMTFMYLDSSVPHPLVSGDTASRKRFFLDFFQSSLGSLNSVRKVIQSEADRLKAVERSYKENTERAKELKGQIPKNLDQLKEECELAEESLNSVNKRAEEYAPILRLRDQLEAHSEEQEFLLKIDVADTNGLDAYSSKLERKIKRLRDTYKAALRFADWKKAQGKLSEKLKASHEILDAHPWFKEKPKTAETLKRAENFRTKLREVYAWEQDRVENVQDEVTRLERDLKKFRQELADLKEDTHSAECEVDKCPTCGGKYNNRAAKERVRINNEYMDTYRKKIQGVKERLESEELSVESLRDAQENLRGVEEEMPKLKVAIQALETILEAENPTDAPENPNVDLAEVDEQLERALETRSRIPSLRRYLDMHAEFLSIPKEQRRAAVKFNIQEVQSLAVQVANQKAELERFKVLNEELGRIQLKRASQLEELADKEAAELLVEATSKKGMERLMIRTLCKRLEEQVNKYAKMMFSEDYIFSFDLQTQFNITVTRRHGKREEVSDVRKLSGAERKLFALVLIPSLLAFVPKNKRSNLLILDEPTAAMGPANVDAFVRFLPLLNSIIKHIVVITPLSPAEYLKLNPRVYTVVKDKHKSVIVEKATLAEA